MISLEKWIILTPLQKLPNNVSDLGKIIVTTGFEWLHKVKNRPIWSHCFHNSTSTVLSVKIEGKNEPGTHDALTKMENGSQQVLEYIFIWMQETLLCV